MILAFLNLVISAQASKVINETNNNYYESNSLISKHHIKTKNYEDSTLKEINLKDVMSFVGSKVKVCDSVYSTRFLQTVASNPTFLNIGGNFPNNVFTVVIFGNVRSSFPDSPEVYYNHKRICITGTVTVFRDSPQIVTNKSSDITIQP